MGSDGVDAFEVRVRRAAGDRHPKRGRPWPEPSGLLVVDWAQRMVNYAETISLPIKSANTNEAWREKSVVSEVQRLPDDTGFRPADPVGSGAITAPGGRPDLHLRVVPSPDARASLPGAAPAPQGWEALLDLTHAVARHRHRVEVSDREQDRCVRRALRQARDGVVHAEEQADRAEHLAEAACRQAEERVAAAEAQVQAAEERARIADLRACHAEAWLASVRAAILSAFPDAADRVAA